MPITNPTPDDRLRWICHTSSEEGCAEIKRLVSDPKYTRAEIRAILITARDTELAGANRKSLLAALESSVNRLDKQALAVKSAALRNDVDSPAAPLPKAMVQGVLQLSKGTLLQLRESIVSREESFLAETLPHRLKMGLACLKAYGVFVAKDPGKRGQGRKPSGNHVTRDVISEGGFEGWLATEVPWLKKATAYKYMTALKGLGLNGLSTEEAIDEAIAQHRRVGPVTLKLLCDQAVEPVAPGDEPKQLQQSEFEFIRDGLKAFREEGNAIMALKPQLLANPDMHRAACARAYQILTDLTGTNWAPSDEADTLATIDPDALAL